MALTEPAILLFSFIFVISFLLDTEVIEVIWEVREVSTP